MRHLISSSVYYVFLLYKTISSHLLGGFPAVVKSQVSASAGVYNEWLYKGIGKDDNIHTFPSGANTKAVRFMDLVFIPAKV